MKNAAIAAAIVLFAAGAAQAEVKDADKTGFMVVQTVDIMAPPARVFQDLVAVGKWWDGAHSYSGNAQNMHIDARAGGCFCENTPDGSVKHMEVVYVKKDAALRMKGGLGPLQTMGDGALTFELAPKNAGTTVTLRYRVWGYDANGMNAIANAVDGVLAAQLARLKSQAETAQPTKWQPPKI